MANFLTGLLLYLFPKEVIAKVVVLLLREAAHLTPTKFDDELVEILQKNLGVTFDE